MYAKLPDLHPRPPPFHKPPGWQDNTRYPTTRKKLIEPPRLYAQPSLSILMLPATPSEGGEGIDPPLISDGFQNHNCLHAEPGS